MFANFTKPVWGQATMTLKRPRSIMPPWHPSPGKLATYLGRSGSQRRHMRVIAEASGGRFIVEAIGRKGVLVRLTVKCESLIEPQPDLWLEPE